MSMSKQRTKVVVRRLPPGLTEHAFKATIDKLLPEGTYNWFSYFQGKVSLRKTVLSRAYLNFVDPAAVYDFKAKFDGHAFITTKGSHFRCTVEYAPFQKVPNPPRKRNPLEGTIDQDPHYQAFLKTLESGPELLPSAAVQREQQEKAAAAAGGAGPDSGAVKVTPLMEYLRNKYLSNPGLRLGGVRRNKGKASAAPPVNAKATKVSGRAAAATAVAATGAKTTSSKQGKDAGTAELAPGQGKTAVLPAGTGPGKGGKQQQQQQQQGKGAAPVSAAPSQQQKQQQQQQQQQQQRPGSSSQAPKIMTHPQQQQQQQLQQGTSAQQIRPSSGATRLHQQDGKGAMGHVKGTAAAPTAAATAAAAPVKLMSRPPSVVQASTAPTPAPPLHAGAPTGRPSSAAAPASSATTKGAPSTSTPSAPKAPTPASSSPAAPAAPPAAVGSRPTAESAAGTQAGGTAPPPSGRPERVRRVRAGFAAYQPKRRGGDEDG